MRQSGLVGATRSGVVPQARLVCLLCDGSKATPPTSMNSPNNGGEPENGFPGRSDQRPREVAQNRSNRSIRISPSTARGEGGVWRVSTNLSRAGCPNRTPTPRGSAGVSRSGTAGIQLR